jgi:hypothetical protein
MTPYQQFLLETLRAQERELAGLIEFFPAGHLDQPLRKGDWSTREHMNHVRMVERRYRDRLQGIVAGDETVPPPVRNRPPGEGEPIGDMVAGYRDARQSAIGLFEALAPPAWNRVFNHPTIWGDVTVEWWAERMVQHTAEHLETLWMMRQRWGVPAAVREAAWAV